MRCNADRCNQGRKACPTPALCERDDMTPDVWDQITALGFVLAGWLLITAATFVLAFCAGYFLN